ncbi:MAG: flagellar motor protein MotB [Lysobacter sp.]|nr:flagellar motor protein MotB [Lysobacter sp.]
MRGALCALLLCALSLPSHAQDVDRLRIHGSNTLGARLVPALAASWLRSMGYSHIQRRQGAQVQAISGVRDGVPLVVEIQGNGSGAGMRDLIAGDAELTMMARAPSARERDAAWQLGSLDSADQSFVLALDGIAVVTRDDNPVRRLDLRQLRALLAGHGDWSTVGGPRLPVHAYVPARGSGSRDFLDERVLGADAVRLPSATEADARTTLAAIAADPGALGVVNLRTPLPKGVHALAIADGGDAVPPDRLHVMSEDYPLTRRLALYGGQMMTALGRSFALYTMTPEGQRVVASTHQIALDLQPGARPAPAAWRPYAELVANAERLPLSLRFNYRNPFSLFDSRSERDLDRLAMFMREPRNRGRSALVVAFSAAEPGMSPLMSTIASNDRADIVAAELQRLGIRVGRARGLGAAEPLASPAAPDARFRNERVEVWLQ